MSKIALPLLTCAFIALPTAARDARIITFDEAVRIALEHNAGLRESENAVALDELAVREARNRFLPHLGLNTSGVQSYGRNFSETEGRIIEHSSRSMSFGVSSGVTLFDGFRSSALLHAAKLGHEAARLDLARTRETLVSTVITGFLGLLRQQEQLRVQQENLAAERALERRVQACTKVGACTLSDLYAQRAVVAGALSAVVEAEHAVELAKTDLIQVLQLDPFGAYEFEAPAADMLSVPDDSSGLQEAMTRALAQRPDLKAAQALVEAADQRSRAARAARWPTMALSAGYGSAYTSVSPLGFEEQIDLRRSGSVGLTFSIPLFDQGSASIASRSAELQAQNARIRFDSLRQEVALQVRRAYLAHRAAREQVTAAETQRRAAELSLQTSKDRYEIGAATLVELSQARLRFVQAESALVSARFNLLLQRTLMQYYVGELEFTTSSAP